MYGKKESILKGDWPDTFQVHFYKGNSSSDGEACYQKIPHFTAMYRDFSLNSFSLFSLKLCDYCKHSAFALKQLISSLHPENVDRDRKSI